MSAVPNEGICMCSRMDIWKISHCHDRQDLFFFLLSIVTIYLSIYFDVNVLELCPLSFFLWAMLVFGLSTCLSDCLSVVEFRSEIP